MLIAEGAAAELLDKAERLLDARSFDGAERMFSDAAAAGADPNRCSAGRWQLAMLRGDFEAAWKESDAIRAREANADGFWRGEAIDGKRVIVRCLHGFGDAVQMLRYAPQLATRAAHVVYETSPKLLPLVRCFAEVGDVITWKDAAPEWDVQVEILELPDLFRTTRDDLPIAERYLQVPAEAMRAAAEGLGPKRRPRAGVVWTCGDWNPTRNVPPAALAELRDLDVEFWNLQSQCSSGDCAGLEMRDARALTDGILPLAATIANLDFVITPDTLAAHLAGALGKPAFVMLQYAADWRWMAEGNGSPWYPSLRLFRQPVPGDWPSVIRSIRNSVARWLA